MEKDLYHGWGKITYDNGDVYEGGWKYSMRHGWGKMTYNNGDVYEGEWENNKENLEAWKKDWREKNKEK